jgi:hypothetical protein
MLAKLIKQRLVSTPEVTRKDFRIVDRGLLTCAEKHARSIVRNLRNLVFSETRLPCDRKARVSSEKTVVFLSHH